MADVCKEYGGALYLLSAEEKVEELYFRQLMTIKKVFEENPEYCKLLSSPSLSAEEKKKLIDEAFGAKAEEYIVSFMKLLCDRGYFGYIIGCIDHFKKVYYEKKNISEGIARSAYPLNDFEKKAITKAVEDKLGGGKTVILNFETDESLLGGFFVEIDGKVIDSTLKTKLSDLKEVLSKPV